MSRDCHTYNNSSHQHWSCYGAGCAGCFSLKCGQTNKQWHKLTKATDHPNHALATISLDSKKLRSRTTLFLHCIIYKTFYSRNMTSIRSYKISLQLHSFNGLLSRTTWVSRHQKSRTILVKPIWIYWSKRTWVAVASARRYANLHLIPDNHASTPPLSLLQAGYPSCHPTNSVKALKAVI